MSNTFRGEVSVSLGGEDVALCLTMGALAQLMSAWGLERNADVMARLLGPVVRFVGDDGQEIAVPQGPSLADFPHIASALTQGKISADQFAALGPMDGTRVMAALGLAVAAAFASDAEKKSPASAATEMSVSH